jgi:asparagine synthase (glutamine-hydrolysing)
MAHGIEVRSPYLDHSIVEMSADMPLNVKLQGRERKAVLRRAVAHLLPPETLARRKQGFGTPVGPWLRGPCRHLLKDLEEGVEDLIPPDRLRVVLQEHFAGTVDHRRRLWSALILSGWRRGPYGDL